MYMYNLKNYKLVLTSHKLSSTYPLYYPCRQVHTGEGLPCVSHQGPLSSCSGYPPPDGVCTVACSIQYMYFIPFYTEH